MISPPDLRILLRLRIGSVGIQEIRIVLQSIGFQGIAEGFLAFLQRFQIASAIRRLHQP